MSKKSTRSSKPKPDPDSGTQSTVTALKKVLYISEKLLSDDDQRLRLDRFYHPGQGKDALFVTHPDGQIMELLEYAEPRRSWLIHSEICSNGRVYMTMPLDATLLALHHLRKHCTQKAMSLENIAVHEANTSRLLTQFVSSDSLGRVADVKVSGDLTFYKYNQERTLAWLSLKTRQVAETLKKKQIHCGHSAQSQNFVRSDKLAEDTVINEMNYTRMACDIVGRYLDADLHDQLVGYLHIPSEIQAIVEEKTAAQKRKSNVGQEDSNRKKIKLNNHDSDAASRLKISGLLDSEDVKDCIISPPTVEPLKERSMTAKEKALAKGAKGTKSIASFFKAK
ncbi:ribonuclease H2 subunit B [Drosophila guanche]|uniref:Ribonuclease H2 subunit B n=1 Tax=Drosophila guanche TaxID=7266 RepID=A0A3B0JWP7_DROGU|nr:ribonuclease H2 subunit B [Drosophila guanche]SPP86507.1 blast:Ribonuclease H2 subunit B [Drosophila guanche]